MKRHTLLLVFVLILALLLPSAALAKKKKAKTLMSDNFQAGLDLGTYFYGAIPYASVEFNEEEATFSGSGGFGPIIGAHFNMFAAEEWIIHIDLAYSYQSGTATVKFDNEELEDSEKDFDYGLEMFRGSVGVGQSLMATRIINPYWLLGIAGHHLAFQEDDEDEAATGAGVGPWGALGVDAKIVKQKGLTFFGGAQFRLDLIYSVSPLKRKESTSVSQAEITMFYVPLSFILTGGVQF